VTSLSAAPVTVRKMVAADLEQVMAIAAALKEAPNWSQSSYLAAMDSVSMPRRIATVAANSASGEVIGFAVASVIPPQAELESIAVRLDAQRKGIGSKLLGGLVEELRAAAVNEFMLEVRASNRAGIAFYREQGWHQSGLRPRYYADPEEDAILMSFSID
jgi:[ribosomal protein S18]-alanine N-acetyltransferase